MSDSFWSVLSNIPHMRAEKKTLWLREYRVTLETGSKSSLFLVTLSLMKVAKSPGGCLFVFWSALNVGVGG